MDEEFLICPYNFDCPIHSHSGDNMVIKSPSKDYRCIVKKDDSIDVITNCTYLHQLENDDKQTALLERILDRLVRIDTNQM